MTGNIDHPYRSLSVALVASLVVHASAGVLIGRESDASRLPSYAPPASLAVQLAHVAAISQAPPTLQKTPPSSARVDNTEVEGTTPVPSALHRTESASTIAPIGATPDVAVDQRARPATGTVQISADPTLGRVGWFLESRSRAEFPVEVKEPVRIGEPLRFDYPADALINRREGAVLAWLMVDADGSVAELDIISGDDDFSVAVANALAAAHFLPATDLYDKPIPFYAVLEFDFRIDGVFAAGTNDAGVSVAPPK